ncbi:hypothetical protein AB0D78_38575 [Streptomyces avermitilis]|uniref:hypothetical protein n=1 Tax=Streptomyces avermitilis TaxID=33903 RepID=UPI0033F8F04C
MRGPCTRLALQYGALRLTDASATRFTAHARAELLHVSARTDASAPGGAGRE